MANSQNQYKDFVHEILTADQPPTPNPQHLDALLHWLAGRDTQSAHAIQRAFDHHQASTDFAQRQTLTYLDRVLFAHDADPYRLFGLIPGCDFADIRARHKQLLQVFHPDRHQHHKDWFTRRSERLNHAYAHLKQNHGKPSTVQKKDASVVTTPTPKTRAHQPPTPYPQPRARNTPSTSHLRARLKEYLGNPATLQQRAFIALFTIPVVLLLVLYVNNQGSVEGGGVATVADNDQTPQTPEVAASLVPRDPADLAGTPIPAPDPEPATSPADPEPGVDAATAATEPLIIASRSADGPHNGGDADDALDNDEGASSNALTNDDGTSGNESTTTNSESDSQPQPDNASTETPEAASQPASESDPEPAREETQSDKTETSQKQPQSEPEDAQQTAAPDNAGTTETTDSTQAEQSNEAGERTDNPQTTDDTDLSEPQEPESTPEDETRIAKVTKNSNETESDSKTNHDFGRETESTEPANTATPADAVPADKTDKESPTTNQGSESQIAATEADPGTADSSATDSKNSERTNYRDGTSDYEAINALLETYATAYKASNINRFSALFQQNAETKHASGRREIKKKYGEFFRNTAERHVGFEDVRIQLLGNRQFKVTAQYQAAWTYSNGRSKSESGQFQFHLAPEDNQLKIWRLNY